MKKKHKIIGTFVPLSSLSSLQLDKKDYGTFTAGLIFLDWLQKTQQSAWQLLPLHETQLETDSAEKHVPCPYKGYGIGLSPQYLPSDYARIYPSEKEKNEFIKEQNDWIEEYGLFCSIRDHFKTDDWRKWESGLRMRDKKTLDDWKEKQKSEIEKHIITQWQLHQAFAAMRSKATKLQIALIGDIPFYLSIQSPLVWANQHIFQLDTDSTMRVVSGMPDSPKAYFGRQVWGHPLYRWEFDTERKNIITLWKIRLRYLASLYNMIRIDHVRAFFEYGIIDPENEENDRFTKGPGIAVLKELYEFGKQCGSAIFVEDTGEDVRELQVSLKKLHIPGIKIFRFALNEKENKIIREYADVPRYQGNSVLYSTTHDTETLVGYLQLLSLEQRQKLAAASHVTYCQDIKLLAERLRSSLLASPVRVVIIPIQDWLLTTERINIPGTEKPVNDPNWQYHLNIPIENLPSITV